MSDQDRPDGDILIDFGQARVTAGRDITVKGKDTISTEIGDVRDVGTLVVGTGPAAAPQATAEPQFVVLLADWQAEIESQIEARPDLPAEDKADLKDQVGKIAGQAAELETAPPGPAADAKLSRLEKLINTLVVMAPDIFDVVVATLANPLAGIGLVLRKVGDRARLERQAPPA
jgi:hypothetical protein